jgi:hypothetical protein
MYVLTTPIRTRPFAPLAALRDAGNIVKGLSLALVIIFNLPSVKSELFASGVEGSGEEAFWKTYVTPGVLTLVALTIAFITGGTAKESVDLFKIWNQKRKRKKALGLAAVAAKEGVRQPQRRSAVEVVVGKNEGEGQKVDSAPHQDTRQPIRPRPDAAEPLNEGGRLDKRRAESESASVDAAEAEAAGVGALEPEDRAPLSRMRGAATRRELAADVKAIKLSLIEKVDRDEIQSIVDGAIRARESALAGRLHGAHGQALPVDPEDSGTHSVLLPEPATLHVNWDEGTRLATVSLGSRTDARPLPIPSLPASIPASLPVKWGQEVRLATTAGMTAAEEDDESRSSEPTDMVWM